MKKIIIKIINLPEICQKENMQRLCKFPHNKRHKRFYTNQITLAKFDFITKFVSR